MNDISGICIRETDGNIYALPDYDAKVTPTDDSYEEVAVKITAPVSTAGASTVTFVIPYYRYGVFKTMLRSIIENINKAQELRDKNEEKV